MSDDDDASEGGWVTSYLQGHVSYEELTAGNKVNPTHDEIPSTSARSQKHAKRKWEASKKEGISDDTMRQLLSGQTQNLLSDYYADALGGINDSSQLTADNADQWEEGEDNETSSNDDVGDPMDDEYIPRGRKSAKRCTSKRGSSSKGIGGRRATAPPMRERRKEVFDFEQPEAVVFGLPDAANELEWTKPSMGRKLPFELEALLGQANMVFARGKHDEAIQMVHEVIRQKPQAHTAYEMLSVMYEDLKDDQKHLQYSLMAAYLNGKTLAEEWNRLAALCEKFNMKKQAIACFQRAILSEGDNWCHYENKLRLLATVEGSDKAVLDTYKRAVQGFKDSQDTSFYLNLVSNTVQKFLDVEDVDGAIKCLGPLVDKLHSEEPEKPVDSQYLLLYSTLLCETQCYFMAALTILTNGNVCMECEGQVINGEIQHEDLLDTVLPPNNTTPITYKWPINVQPIFKARLAVAWIGMERVDLCQPIIDELLDEDNTLANGDALLACVAALFSGDNYKTAENILKSLVHSNVYDKDGDVWLQYAQCLSSIGKSELACEAFSRVVELIPSHVEARISLSALQQQLGRGTQALETLMDEQDEDWPSDERLLYQQCQLLHAQKDMTQFLKGSRRLLAAYFYEMHNELAHGQPKGRPRSGIFISTRNVVFDHVRGSNLEKLVKTLGPKLKPKDRCLTCKDIHDLCFQNAEVLFDLNRYYDMILFCAYAATCPILNKSDLWRPFERLLLLACMKARQAAKLAFAVIRHGYSRALEEEHTKAWNIIAVILSLDHDVKYHRFLLRAAAKQPNSMALSLLNGNCSLVCGTYPHAIAEFVSGLERYPADPLLNLLTAVSFLAVSCKKFILKRHQVLVEALAFLSRYEQARGRCQETYYNFGRALHQANILPGAIHFYRKVLQCDAILMEEQQIFDLKPHAAHNLGMIYMDCGQTSLAKTLLLKYCSV